MTHVDKAGTENGWMEGWIHVRLCKTTHTGTHTQTHTHARAPFCGRPLIYVMHSQAPQPKPDH